ncbi:MAG: hypothetical protein H6701_13155 [Myxococcales bacterium]|nr:hypothetical protein [Myxococcales bacterium]
MKWVVTATGECALDALARAIEAEGFAIEQTLDEIGCIIGAGSSDVINRVRALPGVEDVSPNEAIDIGPPGGSHTW